MFRMSKKFIATVSLALAASFLASGCIGRFALSGKVRKFNLSATEDRWGRELLFLCLYIIPVYPIAGFIDILIINSIEFWTGTNPVDGQPSVTPISQHRVDEMADGTRVAMTLKDDGSIDVEVERPDGERHFVNLVRDGEQVLARGESGDVLIGSVDAARELQARGPVDVSEYSGWQALRRHALQQALAPTPRG